ncbi:MAG: AmmeMemoRadiSam system radical SAM enzyme [Deltaproteobacteria bacterium]|nr:AmmeMemoRadiSam system radical SAM enzyme [Deltaproteobacteria bacterium]
MKEALLYEKISDNKVRCFLCNHKCIISDKSTGICGVRKNNSGTLITLVYDKIIARHTDPIEKKPLFHFLPGSRSFSIATAGCNLKCSFCQNSDISQMPVDHGRIMGESISPEEIVDEAESGNADTIAYTYTEPTIFYELAKDTARVALSRGIRNIFISNGYMSLECLDDISGYIQGANIDLKAFNDDFYKKQCGARLEPVLNTIKKMVMMGIWVEITTLLIPGLNDSEEELKKLAGFIAAQSVDIPWHISRFHPTYKLLNVPPTSADKIHMAKEIGYRAGLRYVYTGNIPGDEGEKTKCHNCGNLLIDRYGFSVNYLNIRDGKCPECQTPIPGVWK